MTVIQQQVQDAIVNHLAACEPCTLEELLEEVRIQCEVRRQSLLPTVITALHCLMEAGKICEYDQMPLEDALEYAWVLSEERTN
jgi:hypothetical protein